jgi:hypothetical protein
MRCSFDWRSRLRSSNCRATSLKSIENALFGVDINLQILLLLTSSVFKEDKLNDLLAHHNLRPATIDLPMLLSRAAEHGIEGMVLSRLLNADTTYLNPHQQAIAKNRRALYADWCIKNINATVDICRLLFRAKIPYLLMKGLSVTRLLYPSANDRTAADVDILIRLEDLYAVERLLLTSDYEAVAGEYTIPQHARDAYTVLQKDKTFLDRRNHTAIEVHWRLAESARLFDICTERLLALAKTWKFRGVDLPVMDDKLNIIFLCCHGARDRWSKLKCVVDIERFLMLENGDRIIPTLERADTIGLGRLAASSFRAIAILYGIFLPETINAAIDARKSDFLVSEILAGVTQSDRKIKSSAGMVWFDMKRWAFHLRLKSDMHYRLSALFHLIVRPEDVSILRLSRRWMPVYVIVGPFLSIFRYFWTTLNRRLRAAAGH